MEDGEERLENLKELYTAVKKYDQDGMAAETLPKFLEEVSLVGAEEQSAADIKSKVHLMTMHSAKGLEFENVFIVGMEEGIFPHSRSTVSPAEKEERRLCYVGITRAKKKVYLLSAERRIIFGNLQANPASRFLREIPEHLLEKIGNAREGFNEEFRLNIKIEEEKPVLKTGKNIQWKEGDRVFHNVFGKGLVISEQDTILTIAFAGSGIRKLDKNIAPIKKIMEEKKSKIV
jgi:DNA helicase-2/ATP-dependent DNA helicase PcrA